MRPLRLVSTGMALPRTRVGASELEARIGLPEGWIAAKSGVMTRYFAEPDETASRLGAAAARQALQRAGLEATDLDLILSASGSTEQAIPCTAALIHRELGLQQAGIPAFDIDSTCLSFVTALDVAASFLASGRYRRILVVSAEIASVGLNWAERESATIMGDGAAAAILEAAPASAGTGLISARMETYSSGAELTRVQGGGTKYPPQRHEGDLASYVERYTRFEMDGRGVFKLSAAVLAEFVPRFFAQAGLTLEDVALVVPHQASLAALYLVQRRLGVPDAKWMLTAPEYGNTIAASIPMALDLAISTGRLQRGQNVMLLGTSAGFSVGAAVLSY